MSNFDYSNFPKAKRIKCRFVLLKLAEECSKKYDSFYGDLAYDHPQSTDYVYDIFAWVKLSKYFKAILKDYDNGLKINEDFLLSLDNKKIKNTIIGERLLKLIKITDK